MNIGNITVNKMDKKRVPNYIYLSKYDWTYV